MIDEAKRVVIELVYFIGDVRFGSNGNIRSDEQLKLLKKFAAKPTTPVLTRDPISSDYEERLMNVSTGCGFGIFTAGLSIISGWCIGSIKAILPEIFIY